MERQRDPAPELEEHERATLRAWATAEVPAGFAERVTAAWGVERGYEPKRDHGRWRTASVAGVVALAAALAALWFSGAIRAAAMESPERRVVIARAPADLVELREEVRGMLRQHCAPCHDRQSADAKNGAIAVFDFRDRAWADALSDEQVEGVRRRLLGKELEAEQVAKVEAFVQRELAWRG